jgi:hypothetical protein
MKASRRMLTADSRSIRLAVALRFGIYNLIRRHKTLGTAPVIEGGEWSLEDVVAIGWREDGTTRDGSFKTRPCG